MILIVRTLIKCISSKNEDTLNMAQIVGKLVTSTIPIQRAVAVTFYTELIGKVDCGVIWLETIINTLHECKTDSSSLVRKHATIGLARIGYLNPRLVKYQLSQSPLYFHICTFFIYTDDRHLSDRRIL